MKDVKKFVVKEIVNVLREEKHKRNVRVLSNDLVEAVKVAELVKLNPKKSRVANRMVAITESKLLKEIHHDEGEGRMLKAQLLSIMENAEKLYHMIDEHDELEDWVQSKITVAEDYLTAVHGFMKYYNGVDDMENEKEGMEDWDEVESDIESIGLDDTFDDMDFEDAEFGEEEWDDEDGDEPFDYFIEDEDEDEEEDEIASPV
jgi:hypothetical protein